MKKSILAICFVALISSAFQAPKTFTLSEEEGTQLFSAIEIAKKGLPTSTGISAQEASQALTAFAGTQKILSEQYKKQSDTTKTNVKPIKK